MKPLELSHDTEADAPIASARLVPATRRGAKLGNIAVPGSAADDTARAVTVGPGFPVSGRLVIGLVPAILNPFPDIAMHVEQPELVGFEGAGRRRDGVTIAAIRPRPAAILLLGGRIGAIAEFAQRIAIVAEAESWSKRIAHGGARCVFPFSLAGQAIFLARFLRQPGKVLRVDIFPGHIDGWVF